jgi:hypothetical protein
VISKNDIIKLSWRASHSQGNGIDMTSLSARHQKTLQQIFSLPTSATLEWRKIEALFVALGAKVSEGNGSRVRFEINQVVASFHRPHPEKEAKVYQVKDAMAFLIAVGVTP